MGNAFTTQINEAKQDTRAEILQESSVACQASCVNIQDGRTIIIDGGNFGELDFSQTCTASAQCTIDNAVQSLVTTIQELRQENKTEASLFGGANFGSTNLNQTDQQLEVEIRQTLDSVCSADSTNIITNDIVYITDTTVRGTLDFSQTGDAVVDCYITNAAIADLNLRQTGDQSNTTSAVGSGIIGLIILVVVIIIIIAAVAKLRKAGSVSKGFSSAFTGGSSIPAPQAAPVQRAPSRVPQISASNRQQLSSTLQRLSSSQRFRR